MEYSQVADRVHQLILNIPEQDRESYYVVFDIDETLITTRGVPMTSSRDVFRLQHRGNFPPIPEMVDLYRWVKEMGVGVALITGRRENLTEATMRNLRSIVGDSLDTDLVFFKPSGRRFHTTEEYKTAARRWIYDQGYRIIANIGDQPTDLSGGLADYTFLLPSTY